MTTYRTMRVPLVPSSAAAKRLTWAMTAAASACVSSRLVEERLGCTDDDLSDEPFARAEPAVDRRAAEAELGCDGLHVDALAVEIRVERRGENVLATRCGRSSTARGMRCGRGTHRSRT